MLFELIKLMVFLPMETKKDLLKQLKNDAGDRQSEQFICPCCGSDKTYKTEAYHCNRCAVTTEV